MDLIIAVASKHSSDVAIWGNLSEKRKEGGCQYAAGAVRRFTGTVLIRQQDVRESVLFIFGRRPRVIATGFVNITASAYKGQRSGNELLKFIITKFAEQHFAAFRTARTMECLTFF